MKRCKSVFKKLKSRCVLAEGHSGKHAYPNALLKKEEPDLWDRLQRSETARGSTVKSFHLEQRGMLDHQDKEPLKPKPKAKPPEPPPKLPPASRSAQAR